MEKVVLLSPAGEPVGEADKDAIHQEETPLHLAFSLHLLDAEGRLLLTRRALGKRAWPGVWTNSCCGHPAPGEGLEDAVQRRAAQELGASMTRPVAAIPDFAYRATDSRGVEENEICPVFVARLLSPLNPDRAEVEEWDLADVDTALDAVNALPFLFSPWMALQAADPRLRESLLALRDGTARLPAPSLGEAG